MVPKKKKTAEETKKPKTSVTPVYKKGGVKKSKKM